MCTYFAFFFLLKKYSLTNFLFIYRRGIIKSVVDDILNLGGVYYLSKYVHFMNNWNIFQL